MNIRQGLLLVFLLLTCSLQAQKVALVLSGGASKGVTHVGVLKALEENNIPIDFIAGTSMGAIIGGLYASGYSPQEIEAYVTSDEFEKWATGEIDPKYSYYFKKSYPDASWIEIKFDYNNKERKLKSHLPTNLISPHSLDFAFMEYYSAAAAVADYNFDSLFVPFRCVASDIESNTAVVFDHGHLSSSIRASMTFPFYFKPIRVDNKLMFDGGMYNNFPVDVAIECFDPDVIIGSKAVSNFSTPDEDDLMSQIQNMIVSKTDFSLPENSILIEPEIPEVSIIDFSKVESVIDSGYQAVIRKLPELNAKIQKKIHPVEVNEKRNIFINKKSSLIIDTIIINGLNSSQSKYVYKLIKSKSKYLTLDKLREEYFKLLADNKISYIYPTLNFDADNNFYQLHLKIKRAERFSIGFGGNVSSRAATAAFLGAEYRFLGRHAVSLIGNGYFGRFYSSGHFNTRVDFAGSIPLYLSGSYTYNHKDFFKNSTYFFEDQDPSFLIQNENFGALEIGLPATNNGKFVNSYNYGYTKDEYYEDNSFSSTDTADRTYFDFFSGDLCFELNSLNNKQFANRGARLLLSMKYITGDEKTIGGSTSEFPGMEIQNSHNWFQLKAEYDNYFKKIGFLTLGFYGELLISNQPDFSNYTSTILRTPAFEPLPDMQTLFLPNYRSKNYAACGLKTIFNIYKQFNLRLEGYVFQPYEELSEEDDGGATPKKELAYRSYVGSGIFVYHSPIGPISLAFNYYDRAENNFSVMFNIGYILFNKGALD